MPIYQVTDPNTGKQVELEGDSPPTEQELEQIFSATQSPRFVPEPFTPNETPGAGINPLAGNTEALLSGGSLFLSDEIQSVIGAATAKLIDSMAENPVISDKTFGQVMVDIRKDMREKAKQFKEQETEFGQDRLIPPVIATNAPEVIGAGVTGIGNLIKTSTLKGAAAVGGAEGLTAGAGISDQDEFLSPGTLTDAGIGMGVGVAGAPAAAILGRIAVKGAEALKDGAKGLFPKASGIQEKFIQQIASADGLDDDLAKYMLKGANVVKDPLFDEATKQGFKPGTLAAIKGATSNDRASMLNMVKIIKRGRENTNFAKLNRPGDVAGDTFAKEIDFVRARNKEASREIGRIANKLKKEPVNIQSAINEFGLKLDELGIDLVEKNGNIVPDFSKSVLTPKDRAPVKEVVRQVMLFIDGDQSGFDAHRLKKAIDNNVTWGKKESLSPEAADALKSLRLDIDDVLDSTFDDYNQANIVYKDTIEALDEVVSVTGRKLNLEGDNVDKQLGVLLRRLMGNQQSRVNLYDSVRSIENTAKKYGSTSDQSAVAQAFFVDDLEDIFGPSTQTAFRSEIGKGVLDAAKRGAQGQRTVVGATAESAGNVIEKGLEIAEGVNEEAAFKVIEQILTR